jgi:hypothetical protein
MTVLTVSAVVNVNNQLGGLQGSRGRKTIACWLKLVYIAQDGSQNEGLWYLAQQLTYLEYD